MIERVRALLVLACCAVQTVGTPVRFRIAAFNVKVFGKSFMANKPAAAATLVRVVRRYDLIMLQEVRDKSGTAIAQLLALVNDGIGPDARYALHLSERLGRTAQKEQLAFFHRAARLSVAATMTYADPEDRWERPPVVVWWNLTGTARSVLATVGVHVDPDTAVLEMDGLAGVMDAVAAPASTSGASMHTPRMPMAVDAGILLMGDLNADCNYVRVSQWACIRATSCIATQMRLWNQSKFKWLIDDDADTTTSSTDCAYDRFVWAKQWPENISDAGVYDFGAVLGLTTAQVRDVSDHYPIELTLSLPAPQIVPVLAPMPAPLPSSSADEGNRGGKESSIGIAEQAAIVAGATVAAAFLAYALHRQRAGSGTKHGKQTRNDPGTSAAVLPEGWQAGTDGDSGKPYYYNSATGESSWEPPPAQPKADEFQNVMQMQTNRYRLRNV